MRKLDNTEVKKYILNILCEFAAFCDQNGLRYYLSGGTLLGAVRHKGFIPFLKKCNETKYIIFVKLY